MEAFCIDIKLLKKARIKLKIDNLSQDIKILNERLDSELLKIEGNNFKIYCQNFNFLLILMR